jgi:hypothetical protein
VFSPVISCKVNNWFPLLLHPDPAAPPTALLARLLVAAAASGAGAPPPQPLAHHACAPPPAPSSSQMLCIEFHGAAPSRTWFRQHTWRIAGPIAQQWQSSATSFLHTDSFTSAATASAAPPTTGGAARNLNTTANHHLNNNNNNNNNSNPKKQQHQQRANANLAALMRSPSATAAGRMPFLAEPFDASELAGRKAAAAAAAVAAVRTNVSLAALASRTPGNYGGSSSSSFALLAEPYASDETAGRRAAAIAAEIAGAGIKHLHVAAKPTTTKPPNVAAFALLAEPFDSMELAGRSAAALAAARAAAGSGVLARSHATFAGAAASPSVDALAAAAGEPFDASETLGRRAAAAAARRAAEPMPRLQDLTA